MSEDYDDNHDADTGRDCSIQTTMLMDMDPGLDYDVARVDELRANCSKSFVNETLTMYYCNSAISVIFFLVVLIFLIRKLKSSKIGLIMPFFLSILVSETVQVIVRHVYQKCALPIRGSMIVKSVVYYGFYINYSPGIQNLLEEIMLGTYLWQNVLVIAVHVVIILQFKKKPNLFVYPLALACFVAVEYGSTFMRSNAILLSSFLPHICAVLSWLICQLLNNHVTNNIFLELPDSPIEAERGVRISRAASYVAFLNVMEVTPRGCAWFVLICTWRVVRNYVSFYTMYYEGYLIMFFIETLKYVPGIKLLFLLYALREI